MTRRIIIAILISFSSLLIGNYQYGQENQIEHLPMILRAMDNSYLQNDYFVNTSEGYGPRYFYVKLMALAGGLLPLPIIFLLLTLLANATIVYIAYCFVENRTRSTSRATLAALLVGGTTGITLGGAAYLNNVSLEPALISLALGLTAYWNSTKGKIGSSLLCGVLAITIHPQIGILTSLILLIGQWRVQALLLAIAYLMWVVPTTTVIPTTELYQIVAEFRNPHHMLPSTYPVTQYLLLFVFLLLSGSYLLKDKKLVWSMYMAGFLLLLGYIFVEIYPVRSIIALQPFRSVAIVKWLGIVGMTTQAPSWVIAMATPILIGSKGDILNLLLGSGLIWLVYKRKYIWILLFLSSVVGLVVVDRKHPLNHFSVVRPGLVVTDNNDPEMRRLANEAQTTLPESVFLTPPNYGKFRLLANRAIVADFKAVPYHEPSLTDWHRRLIDIYGPISKGGFEALEQMESNYKELSKEQLARIAHRYSATHVIHWDGSRYVLLATSELIE